MTNLLAHAGTIQQASQIFAAVGTAPISFVDPYDVAAVAAQVLVEPGHEGRIYEVSGPESLSHGQIAEELSAVLGRRIGYVDVHPEVARQAMLAEGVPEFVTEFILGFFASVQYGQSGRDHRRGAPAHRAGTPDVRAVCPGLRGSIRRRNG